jgi:hypothetical protein
VKVTGYSACKIGVLVHDSHKVHITVEERPTANNDFGPRFSRIIRGLIMGAIAVNSGARIDAASLAEAVA